jgi:hypothetical protein
VHDDDPLEALKSLVSAMEQQSGLCRELLDLAKLQGGKIAELEEAWASLTLEVGRLSRRSRLVVNMKAASLTSTCQKCGAEFATEAGPMLCGPCWCELGKPERYLTPTV